MNKQLLQKQLYLKNNAIVNNQFNNQYFLNINRFHLSTYKYLFFDIFYKNNKLYMILPIYDEPINSDEIQISLEDNLILNISEKIIKDSFEPIIIYIYDYQSNLSDININITYKNNTKNFTLKHIKSKDILKKEQLVITALFKDDYELFPLFYDYYKKQGVTHFYMYYNGNVNQNIKEIFNKEDVTLIEWGYLYWLNTHKYIHHAQLGQMHRSLYLYGDDCEYMIFCDLDEYLYIPNTTILNYILNNPNVDKFGFCNRWSKTINNKIPNLFPEKFLTSNVNKIGMKHHEKFSIDH
jgi:hypothetical protein